MSVKWIELDSGRPNSWDDDTRIDSMFQCIVGWKVEVWMLFVGTRSLELQVKLVYRLIVGLLG